MGAEVVGQLLDFICTGRENHFLGIATHPMCQPLPRGLVLSVCVCVVNSLDILFYCLPVTGWQKMAQLLMGMPRQPFKQCSTYQATGENDPASQLFDQFCSANTFHGIMDTFQQLCDIIGLRPVDHQIFYKQLKTRLLSWKAQSLWTKLDKRAANLEYKKGTACNKTRVQQLH